MLLLLIFDVVEVKCVLMKNSLARNREESCVEPLISTLFISIECMIVLYSRKFLIENFGFTNKFSVQIGLAPAKSKCSLKEKVLAPPCKATYPFFESSKPDFCI